MNFSRLLTIFLLTAMIFTTPANPVHENKNHQKNFFTRSINATASCLDRVLDVAIKYALLKPAQLWFEGQSKSEQERIVLESKEKSVAHESFKKLYGEKEYKDLLTEKTWEYKPIYTSDNPSAIFNNTAKSTQLKALGILFLFISPYFLPSVHSMNSLSANQEEVEETDNALKMLPATFLNSNSICKTMFYLQHNIKPDASPYDQSCYLVTNNRTQNHSARTFIGCNLTHNFFITCYLVDPANRLILAQNIVLTKTPSETYECEPEVEKIYKISDSDNSTTIIEEIKAPSEIYGCSQFDLNADLQSIKNNHTHFLGFGWILAKNFDASISTNFPEKPLCLLSVLGYIMQSFNQKGLTSFSLAEKTTKEHLVSAYYQNFQDDVTLNEDDLNSLTATSGIIAHELVHKLQIQGRPHILIMPHGDLSTNMINWNYEVNADILGSLSLLLNNDGQQIMPLIFPRMASNRGKSHIIEVCPNYDLVTNFDEHPPLLARLIYTLELGRKFKKAQDTLLNSHKSTMSKRLNS